MPLVGEIFKNTFFYRIPPVVPSVSIFRSSLPEVVCDNGVLENFAKFVDASSLIKKETLAQVYSCECCEIFKNIFFIKHLRWLLLCINKTFPTTLFLSTNLLVGFNLTYVILTATSISNHRPLKFRKLNSFKAAGKKH